MGERYNSIARKYVDRSGKSVLKKRGKLLKNNEPP